MAKTNDPLQEEQIFAMADRFFDGDMDAAEAVAFEKRLKGDAKFRAVALPHLLARESIRLEGKKEIGEWVADGWKENGWSNRGMIWGIAAAVVLLCTVAFFLFRGQSPSLEELEGDARMAMAGIVTKNEVNLKGAVDSLNPAIQEVMALFEEGAFSAAIPILDSCIKSPGFPSISNAWLYLGAAHYLTGEYRQAAEAFSEVSHNSKSYSDARFFKGVALVRTNDYPIAKKIFQTISNLSSDPNRDRAEDYLNALTD